VFSPMVRFLRILLGRPSSAKRMFGAILSPSMNGPLGGVMGE
jgi:hypothetical protein